MPTTTIFAGASDGYVQGGYVATYAAARSTASSANTAGVDILVGQDNVGGGNPYAVYEGFIQFDTSGITDTDTVTSAILSLFGNADGVEDTSNDWTMQARTKDWGATLTTADWVAGASLGALTLLATFVTVTGAVSQWNHAAYNAFTETGTALRDAVTTALTGGDVVYILLDSNLDVAGTQPIGSEYAGIQSADNAGTTNDPKLVVVSTPLSTGGTTTMRTLTGCGR